MGIFVKNLYVLKGKQPAMMGKLRDCCLATMRSPVRHFVEWI
jgi:hypothetical protein